MTQVVQEPTRVTHTTSTLIDFIIVSNELTVRDALVDETLAVSDHALVFCSIGLRKINSNSHQYKQFRNLKNINLDLFEADVSNYGWDLIYELHDIDDKISFLNAEFCQKNKIFNDEQLKSFNVSDEIKRLNQTSGQRCIKTNLPWYLLPRQITEGFKTPKIIHVMRDPKKVVRSYYLHCTKSFPIYKGELNTFVDLYINGKVLGGDYFNVVLSYWNQRNLPNILFLTCEEIKLDTKGVVNKVSKFLGKSYNESETKELLEYLGFYERKLNKAVKKEGIGQTPHTNKNELNQDMVDKLDKWILENIKGTNLPYESS
nr:estrogen sulfotransferase-like [Onthophagus taurus]